LNRKEALTIQFDSNRPLGELVYEVLRDAIVNQILKPGERLMETELAEEIGVSRTPVREAIRKLELENYVVMIPRKGTYVAGLSIKDINEVFEIRGALEAQAAALAAQRATQEEIEEMQRIVFLGSAHWESSDLQKIIELDTNFHELIYAASRNNRLQTMIKDLREQVQRFRTKTLAVPGRLKFALHEHKRIVEAIAERDVAASRKAAWEHIESAENALLDLLSYQR